MLKKTAGKKRKKYGCWVIGSRRRFARLNKNRELCGVREKQKRMVRSREEPEARRQGKAGKSS